MEVVQESSASGFGRSWTWSLPSFEGAGEPNSMCFMLVAWLWGEGVLILKLIAGRMKSTCSCTASGGGYDSHAMWVFPLSGWSYAWYSVWTDTRHWHLDLEDDYNHLTLTKFFHFLYGQLDNDGTLRMDVVRMFLDGMSCILKPAEDGVDGPVKWGKLNVK